ncbi:neutral ceramidase [Ixodes scapularis]|uniref:neutral ceramidase n=1 Tax=Ixodes scapularis TaxID=6945 RepID=UPI001A9FE761|nr:neutral ceramidase [Ixodes scapularis]
MWNYLIVGAVLLARLIAGSDQEYDIGIGIGDITGPAAEIGMLGYAKSGQVTAGIHFRVYSRAFIIGDGTSRVVIVNIDSGMVSDIVKTQVVAQLQKQFGQDLYREDNVLLTATHTHSSAGGFMQYLLYNLLTQGFIKQAEDLQVTGIVRSIERAHKRITKGYIYWNEGDLEDANINRSPSAYEANPAEEKAKYKNNTDTKMLLLKFTDLQNNPIGMINWFAVHPTSMNNSNKLISGDNKGYAEMMFEKKMNGNGLPGKGPFIAAFAQSNEGDVSPNLKGPRCIDTGRPCDFEKSTCNGRNEKCIAFGPGKDMFESTKIIGQRQMHEALDLFNSASQKLSGSVKVAYQTVNMGKYEVGDNEAEPTTTCTAALGYSFAAGTTDGPGEFDFTQSTTRSTPFWNFVRDFIGKPSKEAIKCHSPKPILLPVGEMRFPYPWVASIIPTQLLKIGQLYIIGAPGEFTTMSGRRLRASVEKVVTAKDKDAMVVLAGLSNTYTHYVATYEEYQVQRYEGASTIYGPHTLAAYQKQFEILAQHLTSGSNLSAGPALPNLLSKQISFKTGVVYDGTPLGKRFGDVVTDAKQSYSKGERVVVTFVSGHPRNNLLLEGTYLKVEKLGKDGQSWDVVATDGNWETKFYWRRTAPIFGQSQVTVTWDIPDDAEPGTYRIRHFGHSRNLLQMVSPYEGTSGRFKVNP